ncbi:MAG: helix-turn-helix domain-containing protein [Sulfuricella sp.]
MLTQDYRQIGVIRQLFYRHARKRFAYYAIDFDNWRMEIGQVIRALRQERGQTLEQIALEIGTDPSNLSRIERGVQQPAADSLKMIAAALKTTVAGLYAFAEGKKNSPEDNEFDGRNELDYTSEAIQLRLQFRTLSVDNQRALLEIAKLLNRLQQNS